MYRSQRKKSKGKVFGLLALILILVAGGGLGTYYAYANEMGPFAEKNVDVSQLETETTTETLEDVDGVTIEKTTETFKSDRYPFTVTYITTPFDDVNKTTKQFVDKQKQAYVDRVVETRLQDKEANGQFTIDVEVVPGTEGHTTFVLLENTQVNSTKTPYQLQQLKAFRALQNDEHEGLFPMKALFVQNDENLATLQETVANALQNDEMYQEHLRDDFEEKMKAMTWEDFDNFAFTGENIIFYFDEDHFTKSSEAGANAVSIRLRDLNDILTEDYQSTQLDPSKKYVAMTFDDGPDKKVTPMVLDILDKYKAPATFYMLGNRVEMAPDLAKEVLERGHELGNHSYSHPLLPNLPADKVKYEVQHTNELIQQATGEGPKTFRPPYGGVNDMVRAQLGDLPVILWEVDTLDWQHRNPDKLLAITKAQVHNRAVILMHDIHQPTADGLDAVMKYLQDEGYEFITVTQMLELKQLDEQLKAEKAA